MDEELPRDLDPVLMNPKRFLIASILYMLGPRTMSFLRDSLGITWGDLYRQLKTMEEKGYVRVRKVFTPLGPRTLVELTERGLESYLRLVEQLDRMLKTLRSPPP